ncbi:MAG: helix-turn-helix domain-containing protein [Beijerinckiaceae bacterium]|nr:helix-turn-helix domain-containing protein [Beijerinckiaceae bacterium]
MARLIHPAKDSLQLEHVLAALADANRLKIVKRLAAENGCMSCVGASPCTDIPKSTLSHHFRVLREAGIVATEKRGVEHRNVLRLADLEERFPGLLPTVLRNAA